MRGPDFDDLVAESPGPRTQAPARAPFARGYSPSLAPPLDPGPSSRASPAGAGAMISTLGGMKIWGKAVVTDELLGLPTQAERLQMASPDIRQIRT